MSGPNGSDPATAIHAAYRRAAEECVSLGETPSVLFHYCSFDTGPKILESKQLWANNVRYVKGDRKEIEYGFGVARRIVRERDDDGNEFLIRRVGDPSRVRSTLDRWRVHI